MHEQYRVIADRNDRTPDVITAGHDDRPPAHALQDPSARLAGMRTMRTARFRRDPSPSGTLPLGQHSARAQTTFRACASASVPG
jgi:hypothetical protein